LYRVSTHAHLFEEALQDVGLAARRDDGNGFIKRQEVQDAMALLQFVAFPSDILSLIGFLKSPLAGIGDDLLLPALAATKELSGTGRAAKILEFCRPSHSEVVSILEWAVAAAYELT